MREQFDNLESNFICETYKKLSFSDSVICVPVRPVGGKMKHNLILE